MTTIAGAWICGRRMERLDVVMLVNLILVLGPITGAFAQTSCSRNFTVGGAGQLWTTPSNPDFYQNWSASIQFLPGDCLWFNRVAYGYIDEVTAQDYNSCNPYNPLAYFFGLGGYGLGVGPFPVTQTYPQSYLFIENDAANCMAGMKFDATVYDPASVPPPAAPSPTTSVNVSTTPPPPSFRTSPPGPPAPATPPLVGQAVPTTGSGTSSKLSVGAKVGIAVAAVLSALGIGITLTMNFKLIVNIYNNCSPDKPFEKLGSEKLGSAKQKPQIVDQP